jgi:hypothetical protein
MIASVLTDLCCAPVIDAGDLERAVAPRLAASALGTEGLTGWLV